MDLLRQYVVCVKARYLWAVAVGLQTRFACLLPTVNDASDIFKGLHMRNALLLSSVAPSRAGAMLHKRTAVAPHMPATAADMLLPSTAPILYHNQGSVDLSVADCQLLPAVGLLPCSQLVELS